MNTKLFSIILIIVSTTVFAQDRRDSIVCGYGEPMPQPPYDVFAYLSANARYPAKGQEDGPEGKVHVKFLVTENGSIDSPWIHRSAHPLLDSEALRLIRNMPKWKPAKKDGKPIKMSYTMPIIFKLQ